MITQAGDSKQPNGPFSFESKIPSLSSSKSSKSGTPSKSESKQPLIVASNALEYKYVPEYSPLSVAVSMELANPLLPYKPLTVVAVNKLTVLDSDASEHPSPSESKSRELGIPSPSKSQAASDGEVVNDTLSMTKSSLPAVNPIAT